MFNENLLNELRTRSKSESSSILSEIIIDEVIHKSTEEAIRLKK